MAITTPINDEVASIKIDEVTDDVATDFASLNTDSVVYDSVNKLIFKKDLNGIRQNPFESVASIQTVVTASTITPLSTDDGVDVTALAANLTINAPTGTPFKGQFMVLTIEDDNVAPRTLTFNAAYVVSDGEALPTTTILGKWTKVYLEYDFKNSNWSVIGTKNEA